MKQRSWILFFLFVWGVIGIGGRLAYLALGGNLQATAAGQSSYRITIDTPRGSVFDRTGAFITNSQWQKVGVLLPTPATVTKVHSAFVGQEKQEILACLEQGVPACVSIPSWFDDTNVITLSCRQGFTQLQPAVHLVGYVEGATKTGCTGLQQGYNYILQGDKDTTVTFVRDGVGGFLEGSGQDLNQDTSIYNQGVVTTLSLALQQAVEKTFTAQKGAVVITQCQTGQVLAGASFPSYSPQRVADYLEDGDSALLNRMLQGYNVGSIFKLCVVIAALEQGVSPEETYICTGQIVAGQTFSCHEKQGHGRVNMEQALAVSCNPYFIHLAERMGAKAIYEMAMALGLGQETQLCQGITGVAGTLPLLEELEASPAALANFAIGQGDLLATPLQINTLTATIANGGVMYAQSLVIGIRDKTGQISYEPACVGQRVFGQQTAKQVTDMMKSVMTQGTGKKGYWEEFPSAGKTSTAQTGMVTQEGQGVTQAWFTGFVPADNPQYVITVLVEEGISGGEQAAPIFYEICKKIYEENG